MDGKDAEVRKTDGSDDGLGRHSCEKCALTKRYFDNVVVDKEDRDVFVRIQNKLNAADQAVRPDAVKGLDISAEDKKAYFDAAFTNKMEAISLMTEWWQNMKEKYGVPDSSKFDSFLNKFYECVDKNGVGDLLGHFIAKDEEKE